MLHRLDTTSTNVKIPSAAENAQLSDVCSFKPGAVTNIASRALPAAGNSQLSDVSYFKPGVVTNTALRALCGAENPQLSHVCFFQT